MYACEDVGRWERGDVLICLTKVAMQSPFLIKPQSVNEGPLLRLERTYDICELIKRQGASL